jgi:pentatricopeptide repeat protein
MQRVTRTVQRTSLLSECLQRAPSCLRHSIPSKSQWSVRQFSTSRSAANSLPAFEFLHPPVVRDAVNKSRHLEKQTRGYRDENSDHLNNANMTSAEGWNQFIPAGEKWVNADIEKQEQLFKSREPAQSDKETIRRMFQEMDTITIKKQQTSRIALDRHAKLKQELSLLNSSAAKRLENPCDPTLDVKDTFHPELSVERQSSLDAFKAILRGMMEDKERQAVSIYDANDLKLYLNFAEKRIFATYLYRSSHREDLEALLRLFPNNPLVVPALCRLDRLDEAAEAALRNLYNVNNGATRLQVVVVMQVLSNKGEWQKVIDFWEAAVMAPTISTAWSIVRSQQDNILLEHCLSHIPNVMDWYIAKTAAMISDPKVDPKMLEYIKVLGGVIIKGLARVQDVFVDTLKLFRYQVETFREIDQNVLLWEMRSLRMCGRPKAAVEMYLSYRDNEFAVIEHQRDYDEETGRNIKLFIQNEAMASASLLNNFPILKQIFEDIYALGFEPDIYSYSIIMHAFARHGQADTVRELFETYRASGREPNIYVYAELLFVHATLLDIPAVEKTFKEIQAAGLDPGIVVYGMLTTAYARTLDVEGAMRIFRTFIRAGNKPTTMIIGHLISLFANRGDTDAAVEMFNMLGEFELSPDHACLNPLLNAFATVEDRINAEAVVTKMRQLGLKPNIVTWNTLLKMYG